MVEPALKMVTAISVRAPANLLVKIANQVILNTVHNYSVKLKHSILQHFTSYISKTSTNCFSIPDTVYINDKYHHN